MLPKPAHLADQYGAQFSDPAIAAAYRHRIPHPPQTFTILAGLMAPARGNLLDIGCGTGEIARGMLPFAERVDAVDISAPMIEVGKALPGGDDPRLHWVLGRAEEAVPNPPYALITAGDSLHWMQWDVLMPRLASVLAPGAVLALVGRGPGTPLPWQDALTPLLARYSTNREFRPYNLLEELQLRGLFTPLGQATTPSYPVLQSVDAYIESIHSGNGFSRDRMAPAEAAAFDAAVRKVLRPYTADGSLPMQSAARVQWGLPHAPKTDAA